MKVFCLFCLFALCAAAQSVNFSGKYLIERPARFGRPQDIILTVYQAGIKVTGTLAAKFSDADGSPVNRDLRDGKVENGTLTFYIWTGQDKPVKAFYSGSLAGDVMTLAITGGSVPVSGSTRRATPSEIKARRTH